jgi:hypothetical protein
MPWHQQSIERETRIGLAEAVREGFQVERHFRRGLDLVMEGHQTKVKIEPAPTAEQMQFEMSAATQDPTPAAAAVVPSTRAPPEPSAPRLIKPDAGDRIVPPAPPAPCVFGAHIG